ncbi:hypothetical protein ACFPMF_05490 [Larkinella bovis]|uniref:Uncharacterized protein n=1 Tax=Larkinella bovis TaxID=683041 RepID=A0ABW0I5X7_9BACT
MHSLVTLFSLVHSLTKSEKRYFRLVASAQNGDKDYLRLFDCLERSPFFDAVLKEKLTALFPGLTIEPARKYLYRVIMKSLRQFEADSQVETQLMNLLQDSAILFNKGLIDAGFEQLEKAKRLALQHQKFQFFILAGRQELQFLIRLQFAGVDEFSLIEKQEKIRELLAHETTLQQQSSLYEVLLLRYWKKGVVRSQQEITRLNDLLLEEHHILNSHQLQTFDSQQLHLHFQSIYFLMTGNSPGSLSIFYELDALFQKNRHLWSGTPLYYIQLLTGILHTLRRLGRYEEMTFFLHHLQALPVTSGSLALQVKYLILEHELQRAVDQHQYPEALQLIRQHALLERELGQLPFAIQAQLGLMVSRVWFGLQAYSTALHWINRILNQPVDSLNRLLYVSCRLMNLLIHTALDNQDYLDYEIRSIERKLKSEPYGFRAERLVLNLLKQWLKNKPLNEFSDQLALLADDPFEQQLILDLGLKDWVRRMGHAPKPQ